MSYGQEPDSGDGGGRDRSTGTGTQEPMWQGQ